MGSSYTNDQVKLITYFINFCRTKCPCSVNLQSPIQLVHVNTVNTPVHRDCHSNNSSIEVQLNPSKLLTEGSDAPEGSPATEKCLVISTSESVAAPSSYCN
ncbi:MAG: hypothetical protein [Circular genetic element sp.]|nr:MAG: hypothetical protein [Circular genetic element sp.]